MTDIHRVDARKRTVTILLMLSMAHLLFAGCANLAGRSRVDRFDRIAKAYEWALESGNYRSAATYLDPAVTRPSIDIGRYANIKVSQYTITRANVSADQRSIEQDVEIQFFLLDQGIVKTTMDHQVWRYREDSGAWLLQSGLPDFSR